MEPLGLLGRTSYCGILDTGQTHTRCSRFVIEYAKHVAPHLKIIASAGSPDKLDILRKCGADVAINYKTEDLESVLHEHGPIDM